MQCSVVLASRPNPKRFDNANIDRDWVLGAYLSSKDLYGILESGFEQQKLLTVVRSGRYHESLVPIQGLAPLSKSRYDLYAPSTSQSTTLHDKCSLRCTMAATATYCNTLPKAAHVGRLPSSETGNQYTMRSLGRRRRTRDNFAAKHERLVMFSESRHDKPSLEATCTQLLVGSLRHGIE